MKLTSVSLVSLALGAAASPMTVSERQASKSWAGTSNYFLQGMSTADQQSYIQQLASDGVKVLRVWVSDQPGGGSCVKGSISQTGVPELEESFGVFNDETLDLLDQTLVYLGENGIKALISPHDGNKLGGSNGNDVYGMKYGAGLFYESQEAKDIYDARLAHILNYQGAHSGQVWKNWSDVIMAFDLQNEPFAPKPEECTYDTAQEWVCGRAQGMRSVLGDSAIKIASGGFGGDISHGCTFMSAAVNCAELDIISVHRYAGGESDNPGQWAGSYTSWLDQANGKLVNLEEWGVDTNNYDASSEFPANTKDMNNAGLPWLYWQLLPSKKCEVGDSDQFGFFIDSGVPYAQELQAASSADCPQDWSGIV